MQRLFAISGLNTGATVSMQSLDPGTLKSIRRDNIKLEGDKGFWGLQKRFKDVGIQANTDIILCLPGETYETFTAGINRLITNGQHDRILFYNLTILPNAEMGDPAYQREYGMEFVSSDIINIHGMKSEEAWDVPEKQQLVVATNTMSREDWIRTRVFAWTAQFFHFDKMLQIPLIFMHELAGISYEGLIKFFAEGQFGDATAYPTLSYVRDFFYAKAKDIQNGGAEFCHSTEWLDIWWPTDEFTFIDLATSNRLSNFYREAERALITLLQEKGMSVHEAAIRDAVRLNESMVKLPFRTADHSVMLSHNVWEFYRAALRGEPGPFGHAAAFLFRW